MAALMGALVLGLYVKAGGQSGGTGAAATAKVAVVNLEQVIQDSDAATRNRQQNTALSEQLRSEQQRRQQEIVSLQNQIDPLQPGSEAWMNKRDEIQEKTLELEVWTRLQEQNNQREQARQFAEIYQAVTDASAQVAESMGYDIVLQSGDLPDLMRLNAQQLQTVVQTRKVVYAGDAADLTAQVLQRVNAQGR